MYELRTTKKTIKPVRINTITPFTRFGSPNIKCNTVANENGTPNQTNMEGIINKPTRKPNNEYEIYFLLLIKSKSPFDSLI